MDKEDLTSCPFCGEDADIQEHIIQHRGRFGSGSWYVQCLGCGARTDISDKHSAIGLWNTRVKE